MNLCKFMRICVNWYEFIWIKTLSYECVWIYMNINMILFQIIWFIQNLIKFIQICFEFIWKNAHCRSATHCRTAGQPHTAARTAG
jgi:hypothetical protein